MKYNIIDNSELSLIDRILAANNLDVDQISQVLNKKYNLSENDNGALEIAAERILRAQKNNEKIFVFGDYDADGIMATSIMVSTLNKLNINNGYYIFTYCKSNHEEFRI